MPFHLRKKKNILVTWGTVGLCALQSRIERARERLGRRSASGSQVSRAADPISATTHLFRFHRWPVVSEQLSGFQLGVELRPLLEAVRLVFMTSAVSARDVNDVVQERALLAQAK